MNRRAAGRAGPFLLALLALGGWTARAADHATPAEAMRSRLAEATLEVSFDPPAAAQLVREARRASGAVPALNGSQVPAALARAEQAARRGDAPALAAAGAQAWTALLRESYTQLERSLAAGDVRAASDWLVVREYRSASPLSRLNADATTALQDLSAGKITARQALSAVHSDLLDAYQSRLNDALRELRVAQERSFTTLSAENKALAQGYFRLLEAPYAAQRGPQAARQMTAQLAALPASLPAVQAALEGFRAAPLSELERNGRSAQVVRFLSLVPVEYARGVNMNGPHAVVTHEVEVNEARTFHAGAVSALSDIAPLLPDQARARQLTAALHALGGQLSPQAMKRSVLPPDGLQRQVQTLLADANAAIPADWRRTDANADLDVIRTQLDAVVAAAQDGEWTAAETARLDAYALLESGTEARIAVFNPDLKVRLEDLLWNGTRPRGLAALIREQATPDDFSATRAALQLTLADVGKILGTDVAPTAVATNAGIIVFREGLEAVLILAALMGSLRKGPLVRLRRPMWLGAAGAGVATVLTWLALQQTLSLLGRYGEKLEAVVSVIAIGVLLLIMNWFFHQVYWTDRMAAFQKHKHELTHAPAAWKAQWWGLAVLGFTSIYREGFETVLFLQSLVLQAGVTPVLSGTAAGLAAVTGVGALVFTWQAKLPMKKLLIWTGVLIAAVLGVMVGNTVHTLQLVGWLPVHPLPLTVPAWLGLWLGLHATWEGALLQVGALVAVIGSFYLAEGLKERELRRRRQGAALS
ncbi:FTR1 family protein [Deinococcus depolymerans]|uniref:FTR1 family protein n=1 Tax=Deinococcus depolymerans TaxID=392408 RepID=A0ABN1C9I6_9DEIO